MHYRYPFRTHYEHGRTKTKICLTHIVFFSYFCGMIEVEICANSIASARAAKEAGAQRIELCRELECGGLTPYYDDIAYCVSELGLRTHVLIRPRPGDFRYTASEMNEVNHTIIQCKQLGVQAVVVGFLTYDGQVNLELTRRIVEQAWPMEVTFHRAFDEARQDPLEALHAVAAAGCHRLLTSGQRPTALAGADTIRRMVEAVRSHDYDGYNLKILAGSGITPLNVRSVVERTGVGEVHGSCKTTLPDGTIQTDPDQVRALLDACNQL